MSDLFWLGVFLSLSDINLSKSWHLIFSLALAYLCVCFKQAHWLLLSSELCRNQETLPAFLLLPQKLPACPPLLCAAVAESLHYTAGSLQAWGWSRSLSVSIFITLD